MIKGLLRFVVGVIISIPLFFSIHNLKADGAIQNGPVTNVVGWHIFVNNSEIQFDQPPIILNNRILVPLRTVSEALGCSVSWDSENQTVRIQKNGLELSMVIGDNQMLVNNMPTSIDPPSVIIGDRVLVPLRAISEGLGASVEWKPEEQSVYVQLNGEQVEGS